jgi:hypothetical protein
MNKLYIIQWKSKVNGRAGRGTKTFDKSEAEQLVDELNREFPQIVHEIAEADFVQTSDSDDETASASATHSAPLLSAA